MYNIIEKCLCPGVYAGIFRYRQVPIRKAMHIQKRLGASTTE